LAGHLGDVFYGLLYAAYRISFPEKDFFFKNVENIDRMARSQKKIFLHFDYQ